MTDLVLALSQRPSTEKQKLRTKCRAFDASRASVRFFAAKPAVNAVCYTSITPLGETVSVISTQQVAALVLFRAACSSLARVSDFAARYICKSAENRPSFMMQSRNDFLENKHFVLAFDSAPYATIPRAHCPFGLVDINRFQRIQFVSNN